MASILKTSAVFVLIDKVWAKKQWGYDRFSRTSSQLLMLSVVKVIEFSVQGPLQLLKETLAPYFRRNETKFSHWCGN